MKYLRFHENKMSVSYSQKGNQVIQANSSQLLSSLTCKVILNYVFQEDVFHRW